ncbi:MAG: radical SAM protein [Caldilineales bacterium]
MPEPTTNFIVPFVDTVHNRAAIEIQRGCTRGCRFCQAGMIFRPVRERPVQEVLDAVDRIIESTGFEEIGLLSLSSSDYSGVAELVEAIMTKHGDKKLSVGLPSLRIESFSVDLMEQLARGRRRSGFTFAPEAATDRLRDVINKPIATEDLLKTADEVYSRGWTTIKLYFMIGHPTQTMEDVDAIADLAQQVLAIGRRHIGGKAKVRIGVSTLVPKPHTPFQWVPVEDEATLNAQIRHLQTRLRGRGLEFSWNDPQDTLVEAFLSRGDRRLSDVIERAWQLGAKFDGWQDIRSYEAWMQAFAGAASIRVVRPSRAQDRRGAALGPRQRRRQQGVPDAGLHELAQGRGGGRLPRALLLVRHPGPVQTRPAQRARRRVGLPGPGPRQAAPAGGYHPGSALCQS